MRIKSIFASIIRLLLSAALGLMAFAGVSSAEVRTPAAANSEQRLTELKKSLSSAKGSKKSKIMKKIAEIENKVLEQKRSSSQSQR